MITNMFKQLRERYHNWLKRRNERVIFIRRLGFARGFDLF
jgi:hypothetical protein